jgi:uncharacterized protein (DUF58 family)
MTAVAADPSTLLSGDLADRIRELELFSRLRVQGALQGSNPSTLKGHTADFRQHRQYYPGDTLKYLDWRVLGKTGRLFIREYDELTNAQVTVVLDVSGSMSTGGRGTGASSKHAFAVRNAAIILYAACLQRDQFSLALFRDDRLMHLPFRSGRNHLRRAFAALLEPEAAGATDFVQGLGNSTAHVRRRGMTVALSDFMDDPATIARQLASLRYRGSDVLALQVFDPAEADIDFSSVTRFHDPETGTVLVMDPTLVRREYRAAFEAHQAEMRDACRQRGFDHALLPVGEDFERPLTAYLRWRQSTARA